MSFCFPHWQQGLYTNFSPPMSPSTLAKASIVSRGCHFGLPQLQLYVSDADGHCVSMDTSMSNHQHYWRKKPLSCFGKGAYSAREGWNLPPVGEMPVFYVSKWVQGHQIAPVESAPCQTRSTYAVVKAPPPKKMFTSLRFQPVVISLMMQPTS